MSPDSVSVPVVSVSPPLPSIAPEKVRCASGIVSVSVCAPSVTVPLPDSVMIEAPGVVAEMSNVPSSATSLELAMVPAPDSASVPPLIVVAPV